MERFVTVRFCGVRVTSLLVTVLLLGVLVTVRWVTVLPRFDLLLTDSPLLMSLDLTRLLRSTAVRFRLVRKPSRFVRDTVLLSVTRSSPRL